MSKTKVIEAEVGPVNPPAPAAAEFDEWAIYACGHGEWLWVECAPTHEKALESVKAMRAHTRIVHIHIPEFTGETP